MANTWLVVDWLTTEGLRLLLNKLAVAQFGNTDYNKEFTRDFAVGEPVRVPRPFQPRIRNGLVYSPQAVERIYTTVTVDQIFGIVRAPLRAQARAGSEDGATSKARGQRIAVKDAFVADAIGDLGLGQECVEGGAVLCRHLAPQPLEVLLGGRAAG